METIQLKVKFQDIVSTVQLKTGQKLRKAIRVVCNQIKCSQENFKFYHNDRELNETDTPISVNLANNDTILMIKHLREGKFRLVVACVERKVCDESRFCLTGYLKHKSHLIEYERISATDIFFFSIISYLSRR